VFRLGSRFGIPRHGGHVDLTHPRLSAEGTALAFPDLRLVVAHFVTTTSIKALFVGLLMPAALGQGGLRPQRLPWTRSRGSFRAVLHDVDLRSAAHYPPSSQHHF